MKWQSVIQHYRHYKMGLSGGSVVNNLPANTEDVGSVPGLGKSTGKGNGNPL